MAYKNRYKTSNSFGTRHLRIGDALAYGREDMNRVMREILVTEGIRSSSYD